MADLSPAAQAVLIAAEKQTDLDFRYASQITAAALRAAADQVVPEELHARSMRPGGTGALTLDEAQRFQRFVTRKKLLSIANELENHQ